MMVDNVKKVTNCLHPRCKYYLTYNCSCQKPKCRANSSAFVNNGINCERYRPIDVRAAMAMELI